MGAKELNAAQQELFDAVRKGDLEKVQTWLSNKRNKRPRTPLNFLRPTTPQTAWLCSVVDPSNGYTVLHLAALQGHAEVIKLLLDVDSNMLTARDRRGCLPVHLAAWNGHVEAVQVLIDAEPDTADAVNNAKESPLHLSAQHGHGKVVTALLAKHADARLRNARAETALDIAARLGKANVCRLIICNCPELALQSAAECSSTDSLRSRHVAAQVAYPLHAAARHGHFDCLQILCQSGFDLDYVTEEGSALHVAALFGKVDAVKLLLQQDISVETRDSQGRTVLETLREHESERASDLTQVIQSREGWSECRKLIEAHIARSSASERTRTSSCASSTRTEPCNVYQNLAQCTSCSTADSVVDVVWRPIPEGSSARQHGGGISPRHSSRTVTMVSSNGIYHPPSLLADVVTVCNDDQEIDGTSTLSLSTTLPDASEHDSSGQPSPSSSSGTMMHHAVPRFPVTSPNNKSRHASTNRSGNGIPRMGLARASISSEVKAGCSYRAPPLYDSWCPHHVAGYDNVIPPPHPLMAYDNVPRNLLVYDNAPPPGHRRWEHGCGKKTGCTTGSIRHCSFPNSSTVRSDGTQTMPPVKPSRARAPLLASTFKPQPPPRANDSSPDTSSRDGDGVQRTGSTASVVTFACSTLERSVSPDDAHSTPSGTASLARGRAPLALPEDMCGSTTTSVLSASVSPERFSAFDEHKARWRRSGTGTGTGTDDNSTSDKASSSTVGPSTSTQTTAVCVRHEGTATDSIRSSSELLDLEAPPPGTESMGTDLDDLPSPETTKSRIHDFLCSHEELKKRLSLSPSATKAQQTHPAALSPSTTDCSDCTLASSCSLPIISQISSTSPSMVSPTRERSHVSKQCSTDEPSYCSVEVRLRAQSSQVDVTGHRTAMLGHRIDQHDGSEECCECDNVRRRSQLHDVSSLRAITNEQRISLNETNEWRKINEIMESFGGAICRESVFADEYEPKVAVYLRDRRSQALTLQLSGPPQSCQMSCQKSCQKSSRHSSSRKSSSQHCHTTSRRSSQQACSNYSDASLIASTLLRSTHSPHMTAVADWLNVSVGIPNPRAKEISTVLESHGFDSVDHMQCTLDRPAMHEVGLDKSTQHHIGTYLDNYPGQRHASANSFTYVSDWLHSLELEDYLGQFMHGGLTTMLIVSALDPSPKHLKSLGITLLGHQRRILNSLKEAKEERRQRTAERVLHEEETDSGQESRSTAQSSSTSVQKPHSIIIGGRQTEWRHSSTTLIDDCVSYSAHYLGSMEISNVEGTEDSRRAMIKLKKGIREIAKVPQVVLEISVAGVRVLDATTKQLTVEHEITRIQIVCQDERDLNCFAYISQDGDKHFCHVFCVLTADVATEIIITLGQAFEVCYRISNGTYGGSEPIVINPVQ